MSDKIPYYMAYPQLFMRGEACTDRMDYEYMKTTYPDTAKRILPFIEEECDRMEYDASMIYDEYPDQLQLRLMCRRIYERAGEKEENPGEWLWELVRVMTCQEICYRRKERRERGRRFW